jgi:hypothetical protein
MRHVTHVAVVVIVEADIAVQTVAVAEVTDVVEVV